jgi:hypothetical protein
MTSSSSLQNQSRCLKERKGKHQMVVGKDISIMEEKNM